MSSELMQQGLKQWLPLVKQIASRQYRRGGGNDNTRCPYDDLLSAGTLELLNLFERTGTAEHAWVYVHNTVRGAVIDFVKSQHVVGPKNPKNRKKLVVYFHEAEDPDSPGDAEHEGFTIDHVTHTKPRDVLMTLSLEWALCKLRPHEERVMRLYFLADLDLPEIARELDISHQAVSKAIKTGIVRLRRILFPFGYTEVKSSRLAPKRGPKSGPRPGE